MKNRALSFWQPWGSALFVPELKPIETRHWKTDYRGPLVIHAALKTTGEIREFITERKKNSYICSAFHKVFGADESKWFPRGFLIGTVDLVDCLPTSDIFGKGDGAHDVRLMTNRPIFQKYCKSELLTHWAMAESWGDFSPGRFGWCFANPILFPEPIPYKGAQGFFNVNVDFPPQ